MSKIRTCITIEEEVFNKAKAKGINISSFVDIELRRFLALTEGKHIDYGSQSEYQGNEKDNIDEDEWARRDLNSGYQHPKLEGCQATPRAQR